MTIVVAEVLVAVATAFTVVTAYRSIDRNIEALPELEHVVEPPEEPADDDVRRPLDILVMGSDTRAGKGNGIDGESARTERSDTTILLHVSRDRKTAYGVSIPRDTIVDRPSCTAEDGSRIPAEKDAIWNDAFMVGGPTCTARQVEQVTGLYVEHTVVVDFRGFKEMVDAIHGVEVCIPKEVRDPAHGIYLAPGRRLVTGDEALDYVRERTVLSPNADLGRMRRQQAFLASMANRALSSSTLTSPKRLYDFLGAATRSIKLDPDLASLSKLFDLAWETRAIRPSAVKFITAPFEPYPPDPNRVQLAPAARELWRLMDDDDPLGQFSRDAIGAGDDVGDPDGTDDTEQARIRRENGLCA